jgi:putative peptidoglycan lipid II flippase
MHFLIQVPFVARQGLFPKIIVSFKKLQAITGVILVAFPRTLALSAQEVSRFFLVSLASLMSVGSISVFTLSHNLQSVPLSIIGVSYSLAAFPSLAGFFVAGDRVRFIELLQTTARYIIFFSLPLIALFVVLRAHIVRVILGSGEFSWQDTRLTAAALALFVISLAAQGLILLFTRAWYATGNTKTPFYINIFSVIVIIFSAAFLSRFVVVYPEFESFIGSLFRVEDIQGTSVLMLPLAYSFGTIFGACAHLFILNRKFPGIGRNIVGITSQLSIVAVLVGFVSYLTLNIVDNFISLETFWGVFSQGLIAGVVGSVSGIILLTLFGSRELSQVFTKIRNKFWKATPPPVIGPDPSSI